MAKHSFKQGKKTLFVAYDSAEDVPAKFRDKVDTPAWRQIPDGYGEWSGRFVIVTNPAGPDPWTVLDSQPEPLEANLWGERPVFPASRAENPPLGQRYPNSPAGRKQFERDVVTWRNRTRDVLEIFGTTHPTKGEFPEEGITALAEFKLGPPTFWRGPYAPIRVSFADPDAPVMQMNPLYNFEDYGVRLFDDTDAVIRSYLRRQIKMAEDLLSLEHLPEKFPSNSAVEQEMAKDAAARITAAREAKKKK